MRTVICLLRNDLRIHDNEVVPAFPETFLNFGKLFGFSKNVLQVLQWAHKNGDHVIPLFCFDPNHFKGTWHFNFPKTGSDVYKLCV